MRSQNFPQAMGKTSRDKWQSHRLDMERLPETRKGSGASSPGSGMGWSLFSNLGTWAQPRETGQNKASARGLDLKLVCEGAIFSSRFQKQCDPP